MHNCNLLIRHPDMKDIIKESYKKLNNPFHIDAGRNFWIIDLLTFWDCLSPDNILQENNKIEILSDLFFNKSFFGRFFYVFNFYWKKIKSFIVNNYKVALTFCVFMGLIFIFYINK